MSDFIPIYAVDFDGTLCESTWPGIGEPNMKLINHLIKRRSEGAKLILWTCRVGERLQEAVDWCKEHGLEFDAVNDNIPEMIECHDGINSRKIIATCYIDDLSVDKKKFGLPFHEDVGVKAQRERYRIGSVWGFTVSDDLTIPVMVKSAKMETDGQLHIRIKSMSEDKQWRYYECSREVDWFRDKLLPLKGGADNG